MAGHGGGSKHGTLKGPQQVSTAASEVGRKDLMDADGGGGRGPIMQGFEIQVKETGFYPKHHEKLLNDFKLEPRGSDLHFNKLHRALKLSRMDERGTVTRTGHPLVKCPRGETGAHLRVLWSKRWGGSVLGSAVEVEGKRNISERFKK